MNQDKPDIPKILRERSVRYIVNAEQQPTAVLLSLQEYEHYLDLLAAEVATRAKSDNRSDPTPVTSTQLCDGWQDERSAEKLVAEITEATQLKDAEITDQLNLVYETLPSTLDPELLQMQLASIDKVS